MLSTRVLQRMREQPVAQTAQVLDQHEQRLKERDDATNLRLEAEAQVRSQRQAGREVDPKLLQLIRDSAEKENQSRAGLSREGKPVSALEVANAEATPAGSHPWPKLAVQVAISAGTGGRGGSLSASSGGERSAAISGQVLSSIFECFGIELHRGAIRFSMRRKERNTLLKLAREARGRAKWSEEARELASEADTEAAARVHAIEASIKKRYKAWVDGVVSRRREGGDGVVTFRDAGVWTMKEQQAFAETYGLGRAPCHAVGSGELLMDFAAEILPEAPKPREGERLSFYVQALDAASDEQLAQLRAEYKKLLWPGEVSMEAQQAFADMYGLGRAPVHAVGSGELLTDFAAVTLPGVDPPSGDRLSFYARALDAASDEQLARLRADYKKLQSSIEAQKAFADTYGLDRAPVQAVGSGELLTRFAAETLPGVDPPSGAGDRLSFYAQALDAASEEQLAWLRAEYAKLRWACQNRTQKASSPQACQYCGLSFTAKSLFDRHMMTHTGEKPWPCRHPGCEQAFSRKYNRDLHERIHSDKKSEIVCRSPGCEMTFATSGSRSRHEKNSCRFRP